MSSSPLVSVIMSVHNCAPYIEEALGSILSQTYRNLELALSSMMVLQMTLLPSSRTWLGKIAEYLPITANSKALPIA